MHFRSIFDLARREDELAKLIKISEEAEFWTDSHHAQTVMKRISKLRGSINYLTDINNRITDGLELTLLDDDSLFEELEFEVQSLERVIAQLEFNALLSGKYDSGDAILEIHAGAGGTDSQDWVEILLRMYLRWAETHNYEADILSTTYGEEAGIKSVTIAINGDYSYGYLRTEKGVHRLVRLSPFDSAHRRHTSFALVEVLPQVEDEFDIEIKSDDLEIDVYKSSGAGGQNVQKNATAVRITHLPSGIVVTCQNERSQLQNKENAMRVLRSRLLAIKQQEQEEQLAELRGEYTKAEWGSQIRSYVMHPYQMVKDHRTGYETGNIQSVLDGKIDNFIEAYLRSNLNHD